MDYRHQQPFAFVALFQGVASIGVWRGPVEGLMQLLPRARLVCTRVAGG